MMANNSSGARSVLYGKTIDHVIDQEVILADGSIAHFRALAPGELHAAMRGDTFEAECYRTVYRLAAECADEVEQRFPKFCAALAATTSTNSQTQTGHSIWQR